MSNKQLSLVCTIKSFTDLLSDAGELSCTYVLYLLFIFKPNKFIRFTPDRSQAWGAGALGVRV